MVFIQSFRETVPGYLAAHGRSGIKKGENYVVCPVKCMKCKYRRMKNKQNYCILYQNLCRWTYGYCGMSTWDAGMRINRINNNKKIK